MSEEKIFFDAEGLKIEGLLEHLPGDRGVVVTHPHPLYGGSMHNDVVETVVRAYREREYSTLRFNFRGVGGSEGRHDRGVGEREDVGAALSYLAGLGKTRIDLAGYSFGAWVNALGAASFEAAHRFVMVAPPLNFLDFSSLGPCSRTALVIVGSRDPFADVEAVRGMLRSWNSEACLRVIDGADHFYGARMEVLRETLAGFLDEGCGG